MNTRFIIALSSVFLFACSGDDSNTPAPDASTSDATSLDSGGEKDTGTGADSGTPPAGDGGLACEDPSGCSGGQVCCGNIPITGGTAPSCTTGVPTSSCTTSAACPTTLAAGCAGAEQVHFCTQNADCTESAYPDCCGFGSGAGSIYFCLSSALAKITKATCVSNAVDAGSGDAASGDASSTDAGAGDAGSSSDDAGDGG